MFIGRSMIVICRLPIRIIIWIVSPTASAKNTMRRHRPTVDSARPAVGGMSRYRKSTWIWRVRRTDGGDADEDRADQQVARDLLGPRRRVVHHIAREELVEHAQPEQPEKAERQPVLEQVVRQIDRRVLHMEMALLVENVLLRAWRLVRVGHAALPSSASQFPSSSPRRRGPIVVQVDRHQVTGSPPSRGMTPAPSRALRSRLGPTSLDRDDLVVVGFA